MLDRIKNGWYCEYSIFDSTNEKMHTAHYHHGYELYYYVGDTDIAYLIGDRSYLIQKYSMIFVDSHLYHRVIYQNSMVERCVMEFTNDLLTPFHCQEELKEAFALFSANPVVVLDADARPKFQQMMENLYDIPHLEYPSLTSAALVNLLLELKRYYDTHFPTPVTNAPKENAKVFDIINYILKNYEQAISLEDLSKHFFVEKHYMCRIFRKITGQSIIEYVNEKRLIESTNLLINTNNSILEISLKVGFNHVNHFNALFKRRFGTTPLQYRKKHVI